MGFAAEDQMSTISVPSILNVDEDCQDLNQAFRGPDPSSMAMFISC